MAIFYGRPNYDNTISLSANPITSVTMNTMSNDYLRYVFPGFVPIKGIRLYGTTGGSFVIQGSNNETLWTTLLSFATADAGPVLDLPFGTTYTYYDYQIMIPSGGAVIVEMQYMPDGGTKYQQFTGGTPYTTGGANASLGFDNISLNYGVIDEVTLDESDYVWRNGSGVYGAATSADTYNFTQQSNPNLGTINSITINGYGKLIKNGSSTYDSAMGFVVNGTSVAYFTLTATDTLYSATIPPSVVAHTWTAYNSLIATLSLSCWGDSGAKNCTNSYCYQFWIEVDYSPNIVPSVILF